MKNKKMKVSERGEEKLECLFDLLRKATASFPQVHTRTMFGCQAFFREESIFGLIWKAGRIGLKIPDQAAFATLMAVRGSEPWVAGDRVMSKWILLPPSFEKDPVLLHSWVSKSYKMAGADLSSYGSETVKKGKITKKRGRLG